MTGLCDEIDFDESGDGRTIVFIPGSCSTGAAWRPVIAALSGGFRCVTTSLPGYGRTAERRSPIDPPMVREVEVVEAVIRRAAGSSGKPVHLVGHSFGAHVALVVAARRQMPLASLFIAEPPVPDMLLACNDIEQYHAFRAMTDCYFASFHNGEPEAIAPMIDFYGGEGTFASWPRKVRDYAIATTASNILDWQSAYEFRISLAFLKELTVPTQLVCGALSHPAVRKANELLSVHLGCASLLSVAGAAHFMIATHPEYVADLLGRHVIAADASLRRPVATHV